MIAKRINQTAGVADNYTHLAEYIAAAGDEGEKLDRFWIVNCDAGDTLADLDAALAEIEAVRKLRADVRNKTYHLVVSFRPEDQKKLDDDKLKAIASRFAEALGYGEHQYVAGTHVNTDNFHMHIAFNKVHPETLKVKTPFQDFKRLDAAARALEKEYGLAVDRGMSDRKSENTLSPGARDFEANTWTESFQRHVLRHKDAVLAELKTCQSWQDVHAALARHDIRIRPHGAGLVLTSPDGGQTMKASALHRSCSKAALERRFGAFEPAPDPALTVPVVVPYKARPLVRRPESTRLWRRYLDLRRPRSTLLGRTVRNWKMYLMSEAFRDPLAIVLVMAHQEFLALVVDQPRGLRHPPRVGAEIRQALAAWRDTSDWSSASPSAWVKTEKLASAGVRVDDKGNLVVPFRDGDGHIQGVRMVGQTGATLDLGHLDRGVMHIIDPKKQIDAGARVVIASDYHLALAIHRATRAPVVVAPSDETVPLVINALEHKYGPLKPVIAAQTPEIRARVTAPRVLVPAEAETLRSLFAEALDDAAMVSWNTTTGWATPENNQWLAAKGVPGFGVRQCPDGSLAVPLRTLNGRLEAVIEITSDGRIRRNGRGSDGPPLMHIIDPARLLKTDPEGPVVIATGYAEAAAIHRATRVPVVMAPSADDWSRVAGAVRDKWPRASVVAALPPDVATRGTELAEELGVTVVPESATRHTRPKYAETLRGIYAEAVNDQVWLHWSAGRVPASDEQDAHQWLGIGRMHAAARLDDADNLLLPLRDSNFRLAGVMAVDGTGKVQYQIDDGGQETPPLFHVLGGWLGRPDDTEPVIVTDDLPTALALHRETPAPVVFVHDLDACEALTRYVGEREVLFAAANDEAGIVLPATLPGVGADWEARQPVRQALKTADVELRGEPRTEQKAEPEQHL